MMTVSALFGTGTRQVSTGFTFFGVFSFPQRSTTSAVYLLPTL